MQHLRRRYLILFLTDDQGQFIVWIEMLHVGLHMVK
jgi:hypothetical protein